mgnify:CR=1 FL=1
MKAQYIAGLESLSDEALREALACLESHAIANVNWKEYPYSPAVNFKLGWSDKAIAVMFEVTEAHVKAVAMEDNGHVWEDSCVETFIEKKGYDPTPYFASFFAPTRSEFEPWK